MNFMVLPHPSRLAPFFFGFLPSSFAIRATMAVILALGCLGFVPASVSASSQARAPVAQAALSVGDVRRVAPGGKSETLRNAAAVYEGDRLMTGPDGMVILVFIDKARVSLRSDSELAVTRYKVSSGPDEKDSAMAASSGAEVAIQLDLVRGAMRQISGEALKAQPGRYRLNTPVAAIGVRGTDFLAKTSSEAVETFIQEGSIVLLPLNNGCGLAADTGSCRVIDTLMASDPMRYIRLTAGGNIERRGVGVQELEQVFGIRLSRSPRIDKSEPPSGLASEASPSSPAPLAMAKPSEEVVPASNSAESAEASAALPAKSPALAVAPPPRPAIAEAPVVDSERLAAESSIRNVLESIPGQLTESSLPEPTPLPEPSGLPAVLAPLPTQLVWGRFSFSPSLPVSLPLSFANASQGRDVTVGDFSRYALWREGEQTLEPQLKGRVDFQVSAVEAYLEPRVGPPSVANVEAARLGIDFDAARFEAAFRVNHPVAGRHRVEASGAVRPDGLFAASEPGQRVAGAVTANGQEAGVFFSKDISDGSLRGLSLWRAGQ